MGLDTVELVMAFEDEFALTIADSEAERMSTPGDVADYLMTRLRNSSDDPYHDQAAFYRVRSILRKEFSVARKEIRPATPLKQFIKGDIRTEWPRLWKSLHAEHVPALERTPMQISLHIVVGPALLVIGMLLAGFPQGVVMMSAFGMLIVANAISRRSARTIPAGVRTVAQLVPFAGGVSSAIWTREEVLSRVIRITSEQLGIPVAKISEQSHFVHDLGAD